MIRIVLVTGAAALLTTAAGAYTVTSAPFDVTPGPGETTVFNFNGGAPTPGYSYSGGTIYTTSVAGVAAQPAMDTTPFLAIAGGTSATFNFAHAIKSFSIYIGSVDAYNFLRFQGPSYDSGTFSASVLPGGDNGDQTAGATNRRFSFNFGADRVKTITLSSKQNAFELDNIAVAGVPEPSAWMLLLAGFGLVGFASRRRSASVAA